MPGIKQKRLVKYEAPEWAKQVKNLPRHYVKVIPSIFYFLYFFCLYF